MANVHMKSAATNMRQAVDDINLKLQEIKADLTNRTSEIHKRINDIKNEQRTHLALNARSQSDVERSVHTNSLQDLQRENDELNRQLYEINDQYRKTEADLNRQMNEFQALASRLDATA